MARFKQNAHDVYELNADFIYHKTLTKTVGEPSNHIHGSDFSWKSDGKITLTSPKIVELYKTINRYYNLSGEVHWWKSLVALRNVGTYGYSKNSSYHYRNISGITTNTGLVFILPGPRLQYFGKKQIVVSTLDKSVDHMKTQIRAKIAKKRGLFYIEDAGASSNW